MTQFKPARALLATFFLTHAVSAQDCILRPDLLDRGEETPALICSRGLKADYTIEGLDPSGIDIAYRQYLARCDVNADIPGLYLVLRASPTATAATLSLRNKDGTATSCNAVPVKVPARKLLSGASLQAVGGAPAVFKLVIEAKDADLRGACPGGLSFPESRGAHFALLEMLSCGERRITAHIKVSDERRDPAKIVISSVGTPDGVREGIAYVRLPPPAWAGSMPESDARYVDVRGIRTRYFVKGKGPALLLVHGGQPSSPDANAWTWTANFDGLSRSFRVYAIDRIGQGYTDNPKTDDDYAHYYERVVEHVYGFIESMGLNRVGLVGHSQGGWPVTRIALDHPERVSCLVNVDTSLVAPADPQNRAAKFYRYQAASVHPREGHTRESLRRSIAFYSVSGNNLIPEDVEQAYALSQTPKFKAAAEALTKAGVSPASPYYGRLKEKLMEELEAGKLQVPTLIVWGRDDPEGSYESGVALFSLIAATNRNAAMHTFANSGHASFVEYPERFNALVAGFCGSYD